MSKRGATKQEREDCMRLYRALGKTITDYDIDAVLNTMCFVVAELGTDLDMSKQAFIAQVVEQLSSAYDTCYLGRAEPQGEA